MEIAFILLLAAAVAVGVVSAVVRTWSLHARLYSLEDRVSVVEGVTQREVKIRAATSRAGRPTKDEDLLKELAVAQTAPAKKLNFWETSHPRSVAR
jgi:hypothetical protein